MMDDSSDLADGLLEGFDGGLVRAFVGPAMEVHGFGLFLADEVVLRVVRTKPLLVVFPVVHPAQLHCTLQCTTTWVHVRPEVCQRTHLSVNEGVPQDQLLMFKHTRSSHLM